MRHRFDTWTPIVQDRECVNANVFGVTTMTITAEIADVVAALRAEVAALHAELPRWELVVWTAGNVSARVPGHDLLVIKPSGVSYDELTARGHGGHRSRGQPGRR